MQEFIDEEENYKKTFGGIKQKQRQYAETIKTLQDVNMKLSATKGTDAMFKKNEELKKRCQKLKDKAEKQEAKLKS